MASDPDDVNGQAMMALTPAEAQVLVAAVGEPATPNAERGAGPATYHPMHAPHGVRPGAPAKPVPAAWRVGSTLLVLVACTLIGGAIAVEQGHLRLNAALIWAFWNLGLTLAVVITHLRRLSKRPLAPVTVKRLLLVACVSIMASFWALPIHIYACTLVQAPAALGDISARLMATITCAVMLLMAGTLALLTKGLHRAERQSRRAHYAFMTYYVLVGLGALAAAAVAFVKDPEVSEIGGLSVSVAVVVFAIAVENQYRYRCFVTNRPVHNHLLPLLAMGWGMFFVAYGIATFEAVRIVQAVVAEPALLVGTTPYAAACAAALWLYRWAFSMIWTAAFYMATEGNTARFLRSSRSRFAAGLFGIADSSGGGGGSSTDAAGRDAADGGSDPDDDDDVDDLDALLLSDDEFS